eukprot:scaffold113805_cov48-Phaeocystis_antarctica.AAC.1
MRRGRHAVAAKSAPVSSRSSSDSASSSWISPGTSRGSMSMSVAALPARTHAGRTTRAAESVMLSLYAARPPWSITSVTL